MKRNENIVLLVLLAIIICTNIILCVSSVKSNKRVEEIQKNVKEIRNEMVIDESEWEDEDFYDDYYYEEESDYYEDDEYYEEFEEEYDGNDYIDENENN